MNNKFNEEHQKNIMRNAIASMAINEAKDNALLDNDVRRYKNYEIAQAVNNALFYKELGLLDAYLESYKEFAENVSDKDLEQLYTMTYNKDIKESPLSESQKEDVRKMYKEKAQSTVNKI